VLIIYLCTEWSLYLLHYMQCNAIFNFLTANSSLPLSAFLLLDLSVDVRASMRQCMFACVVNYVLGMLMWHCMYIMRCTYTAYVYVYMYVYMYRYVRVCLCAVCLLFYVWLFSVKRREQCFWMRHYTNAHYYYYAEKPVVHSSSCTHLTWSQWQQTAARSLPCGWTLARSQCSQSGVLKSMKIHRCQGCGQVFQNTRQTGE
jgi:hypothetical protein